MQDEIDKALDEIEKNMIQKEEELPDISDNEAISLELIKMVKDDRKKADEIFELFYSNLGLGTDRSQASKEAITKALELKIEASKNIIELLKIKSKSQDNSKVNLFVNTIPPKKTGIDLNKIKNERKRT